MFVKHTKKIVVLFSLALVAGCSTSSNLFPPAGDKPFNIQSVPSGAAVYVMGENIGVTPLKISLKDVFPNIYPKEKISLYGKVTLKKSGCSDFTRTIDGDTTSYGLHAKLDCGNSSPALSATPNQDARSTETVEQRLDKIKALLDKGLISADEAKQARERILKEI